MARLISILLFALAASLWLSVAPAHSAPLQCTAGTYGNGTTCATCPAGNYCPTASTTPTACPAGDYCPTGAGAGTLCPAGYYCPVSILWQNV